MFVIKSIVLTNYNMFKLNNVKNMEYLPDIGMNTILGGNGAGKTKLLSEASPLPINKKSYTDGGKRIVLHKDDDIYDLYSGNHKQSFLINGEELNNNGLITTQAKLVLEHFGLDTDIRDLNLGDKRFTTMSSPERKKWFTRISTTDYEFSIKLFNRLKTTLRDLRGSIKLLNGKNISVDDTALNSMLVTKKELLIYKEKLTSIIHDEVPTTEDPNMDYISDVEILLHNLSSMMSKGLSNKETVEYIRFNIDAIESKIKEQQVKIDSIDISSKSISNVDLEIKDLEENINAIKLNTSLFIVEDVFSIMFENRELLISLLESIKYNREEHKKLLSSSFVLQGEVTRLRGKLDVLEANKEVLENNKEKDEVDCPKCSYKWKVGFNEHEYEPLIINIKNTNESLDKFSKEFEVNSKELEEAILSMSAIEDINILLHKIHSETIREFIEELIGEPNYMIHINTLFISLANSKEIFDLDIVLKDKKEKLKTQTLLKETDIKRNLEYKNELEVELGNMYTNLSRFNKSLIDRKLIDKQNIDLGIYSERLTNDIKQFDNNTETGAKALVKGLAIDTLDSVNLKLDILINNISRLENDKVIIEYTNKKIKEEKRRIDVIETLMNELSPDSGIIAESLSNFMHIFIEDMNTVINSIWTYELNVLPCTVEDGDLDYVFKVKLPNTIVNDVKDLSTGQRDIVDFAFKLTTMNYLDILDTPILLDEIFMHLEPKHKELAFKYLDELIGTSTISQAFMVSHRDESYTTIDDKTVFLGTEVESKRMKIEEY